MNLIGVSGTNGSGKDSLGQILADDYGWLFVSVSDFLRDEAKKRGQPVEREVLRSISAEWRRKDGLGALVNRAVELFNQSQGKYKGVVAIAMRNPGEAQRVIDLGGKLVWVDADPKVRYDRIYKRGRSAEDNKTFEQFKKEEYDEMHHHGGDDATLNMAGVKAISDIFIDNNTDNLEDFKQAVQEALNL
jgi:cytidylate kinase